MHRPVAAIALGLLVACGSPTFDREPSVFTGYLVWVDRTGTTLEVMPGGTFSPRSVLISDTTFITGATNTRRGIVTLYDSGAKTTVVVSGVQPQLKPMQALTLDLSASIAPPDRGGGYILNVVPEKSLIVVSNVLLYMTPATVFDPSGDFTRIEDVPAHPSDKISAAAEGWNMAPRAMHVRTIKIVRAP